MNAQPLATNWPKIPLDSLLVFLTSGSRGWAEYYADSGSLFLRIQNVGHNQMLLDDVAYVNAPDTAESNRTRVQPGEVLLSITADLGRTAVVPDQINNAFINQHLAILRTKDIHPQYLSAFLSSPSGQRQILGRNRHGVKAGLNFDDIRSFRIPIPSLPEQRRIAEVLDRAEALRAKRRAALAQLDTLTQSIFLDLFGDPVTNPKGWPISGIEQVCELIVDCVNRTAPVTNEPTAFKMIRTSNVKNGRVNLADVKYVTKETFDRWNRRATPQPGDVLLTREAPVGEAGMLDTDDTVFLGQRLMLYRANSNYITPTFLLFSFLGKFLQNQFDKHGSGSTVKHLPLPVCRSFKMLVPPISLQHDFARRIAVVDKLKSAHRTSLAKLDALFASLQHRAFRGEL